MHLHLRADALSKDITRSCNAAVAETRIILAGREGEVVPQVAVLAVAAVQEKQSCSCNDSG